MTFLSRLSRPSDDRKVGGKRVRAKTEKKGWKMTVRCSDLLQSDELRAHSEDHPLQQSRVARSKTERERGGTEERGKTRIRCC